MLRILTLMDNSEGAAGTTAEHGLSFLIERKGRFLLFDTGETGRFLDNARVLGAGLEAVEAAVISHGHHDHGGGFPPFIERTAFNGPLWTGGGFFDRKWSDELPAPRFLGVNFDAAFLEDSHIEHRVVSAPSGGTVSREVCPGVYVVNGFPRIHAEERQNPRFVVDRGGNRVGDDFREEVCLAIEVGGGLAVVLGCAHPGLMNMLDAVKESFGKPVVAVFGGSHLVEADGARLAASVAYLAASSCRLAALGHCTGTAGTAALAGQLPAWKPLKVGSVFRL